MKVRNIAILTILVGTMSLFTGCSLTGNDIVKQGTKGFIVQSNVEMTDTNVNSQIAGKISEVKVKEGETVETGQVLITMNSDSIDAQKAQIEAQIEAATSQTETVTAQINSAKAARDAATAKLEAAQNGARTEDINQAKSVYDLAKATYDRTKTLYDEGSATKADLDKDTSSLEIAKNKYDTLENGTRPEDIKAAQAQVDQANASVEAAEGQLKSAQAQLKAVQAQLQGVDVNVNNAIIVAPTNGVISQLSLEAGEMVSTGMPLAVIINTDQPSIMCHVKETDISKVDLEQEVCIKIPAYEGQEFTGKVVRINKDADFAIKRATNDSGEFDILSYGVKVEFTDMDKPLRAGMTAFVDFGE